MESGHDTPSAPILRQMAGNAVDERNTAFWDTLCGWNMARAAGITGTSPDDLRRFDELFLEFYPYLESYIPNDLTGKKVLEAGLGFGTLGQLLAMRGAEYAGVDIAAGPVAVMRQRMEWLGRSAEVVQASVLELPFDDRSFDYVYSIGCLHHTGDLQKGIDEVHRVLVPGGRAVVMLYNGHSLRRALHRARNLFGSGASEEEFRAIYDAHESGEAAPHTDFVSRAEVRRLFGRFSRVRIDVQNFDDYPFGIRRKWFLSNLARLVGLDLYIVADKI